MVMALDELEILFYRAFMTLLGENPEEANERPPVRRSWPTMGQPDWSYNEDVLFFQLTFLDGQDVSQPLHDFWQDAGEDLNWHQEQTRVMQAQLIAYGPNGATNLDNIRTAIYNGVPILRNAGVYVVPGNEAPRYAPELFQARWWRRADMTMVFNVAKSYDTEVKTITSVPVTIGANRPGSSTTVLEPGQIIIKKG
jgi:hypothetical protein